MSIIIPANTLSADDSLVTNSVRLDGASSFMTKTMGTPTNTKKYTMSVWFKRSKLDAQQSIFRSTNGNASNDSHLTFNSNNTLRWQEYGGSAQISSLVTNQLFRDTSAWSHVVVVYDSAQSTASNRAKMYVNGTEVTSFGTQTQPSLNADSFFNKDGEVLSLGRTQYDGGGNYFSGYVAEVVMCDGQALAADQFGEFDEDSEIWKPIDVSDLTFGTNGFYLDFEASGNLGNDANGGTDFGESGLAATDQSTDTCENNFATFNSLTPSLQSGGVVAYSEGNTKIVTAYSNTNYLRYPQAYTTLGVTTGKWYAEFKIGAIGSAGVGIANTGEFGSDVTTNPFAGAADSGAVYTNGGEYRSGIAEAGSQGTYTENDIIGCALDMDNLAIYWHKNGTYINSGNPTSGSSKTGARAVQNPTTPGGFYVFTAGADNTGVATIEINLGSPSYSESGGETDGNGFGNFNQAVPSGYFALCTKNLAEHG